jgi:hypothetical protein
MHDTRSKCQHFARDIQALFNEGLHVSQNSRHFIFSTISMSDIRELEALLTDPFNCECDSLIELIFFPDESTQMKLEDRLEAEAFQQKDEQAILENLLACRGKTLVRFDGLSSILTIPTPASGARAFLARLNITRHLDPGLLEVIDRTTVKKRGRKYRVWLRNMVMDLHERDVLFLKHLFVKMDARGKQFDAYLFFALRFLEESRNEDDLFQSLSQHRNRCLRHLQQNERFEAYRRNHTIETLMAHGMRIPHMDKQALLCQVALVDDIRLALFDRSM